MLQLTKLSYGKIKSFQYYLLRGYKGFIKPLIENRQFLFLHQYCEYQMPLQVLKIAQMLPQYYFL